MKTRTYTHHRSPGRRTSIWTGKRKRITRAEKRKLVKELHRIHRADTDHRHASNMIWSMQRKKRRRNRMGNQNTGTRLTWSQHAAGRNWKGESPDAT